MSFRGLPVFFFFFSSVLRVQACANTLAFKIYSKDHTRVLMLAYQVLYQLGYRLCLQLIFITPLLHLPQFLSSPPSSSTLSFLSVLDVELRASNILSICVAIELHHQPIIPLFLEELHLCHPCETNQICVPSPSTVTNYRMITWVWSLQTFEEGMPTLKSQWGDDKRMTTRSDI